MFWACAILRLQVLPQARLIVVVFYVNARTNGTLIGSRSAVAAGRILIESVVCSLAHGWAPHGVKTDVATVVFVVCVGNYSSFGNTLHDAIDIAESLEAELLGQWSLEIKPGIRSMMSSIAPDLTWD